MASFSAIRTAVATALATLPGLQVTEYAPDRVNPPAAFVMPDDSGGFVNYDSTMQRGADDFRLLVRLTVGKAVDDAAQGKLDKYLAGSGEHSVKQAIDAIKDTVDGISFSRVVQAQNYQLYEHNGVDYLGCEFVVEVTAIGEV